METKEQSIKIKSCTSISNMVREGASEEKIKIEEASSITGTNRKRPKIVDKRNRLENIALDLKIEKKS